MLGERGTWDSHKPHPDLAGPLLCGPGAHSLLQFTKTAALTLAGGKWMDPWPKASCQMLDSIELAGWALARREGCEEGRGGEGRGGEGRGGERGDEARGETRREGRRGERGDEARGETRREGRRGERGDEARGETRREGRRGERGDEARGRRGERETRREGEDRGAMVMVMGPQAGGGRRPVPGVGAHRGSGNAQPHCRTPPHLARAPEPGITPHQPATNL
ncbi:hypothetical protein NDU88_008056 [Pleurodeles waltl]|uniref:Uncharacterized protein n=1 Tax=Pleurodeles waltl TaxID=8319 RepID=A0AAV7QNM0_PLEWA|nr:hypothetical protein NDU88_008056 [Pleurodeles waltl]